MITIKRITENNKNDINHPNEPFQIWGKLVPSLTEGKWDYHIQKFKHTSQQCFPNYDYQYDPNTIYLGAYDHDQCIGIAILEQAMFKYLYLDDLKVDQKYRGKHIGSRLIKAALNEAHQLKLQGVYTIAQDNNLSACLFYLKNSFEIGGFNNRDYRGTAQEGKADIYFYRDCK
ncbi:GNAT family N-acetyltransferase [Lactobacillus kefiranofaciens subsp. kefirgranum]|nr:GNAT family N-acetyltransferase [Lactobacillus kefiranofaciens]KRL26709.1 streptothricine-acetyl-transferase [Lactobacillus kefiranofaciens subsp. kefirgranum DSM 10550 = JCM 8572]MCJ2172846.1 GNAT family N-acetyltransferase [Lactobacillus kefiranofaciens]MCP9331599.1 GNAT family N-acetyltransferase [Lactobacillus kefiranofaciens]MDF4141713.1 GNAT family N-acetyltransferase [Lactobacillus kefiranofaciens]MDH5101062.1 GNAT family N-acetyltransferase [Lactobacillus kefiranofaciens]